MAQSGAVLIIDDDALVHEFLGEVIPATTGCRTLHAYTLQEGRKFLAQGAPSLILIDGKLPDGRSDDWVKHLSADPRWKSVPKYFLSGSQPPGWDAAEWEAWGVRGYLLKPVPLDRLIRLVEEALGK